MPCLTQVLEAIGRALKAHYDDLLDEPLPAKFLELLDRLEAAEARETAMPPASFKDELVAEITNLRAFAISLSGSASLADDPVQETLLRAWSEFDNSSPDEFARVGCSPSCATSIIPTTASALAKFRTATAPMRGGSSL